MKDQRNESRVPINGTVELWEISSGKQIELGTGLLNDITPFGASISLPAAPEIGTKVYLASRYANGRGVVRNVRAGHNEFDIGIEFPQGLILSTGYIESAKAEQSDETGRSSKLPSVFRLILQIVQGAFRTSARQS